MNLRTREVEKMEVIRILSVVAVLVIITSTTAFGDGVDVNPFLQQSLAQVSDKDRSDLAEVETLNRQGMEFSNKGQYEQTVVVAEKERKLAKKSDLPRTVSVVGANLCNLAAYYYKQTQYAQAEPLYRMAQNLYEEKLGSGNPAVAVVLNNLGSLHERQGHLAQAEQLYKRAIEINESSLGMNHRNVAVGLKNLAGIYRLTHQDDDAAKLEQRAATIEAYIAAELEKLR
jgi:tetratricopeptide (TPR) repeat protein